MAKYQGVMPNDSGSQYNGNQGGFAPTVSE